MRGTCVVVLLACVSSLAWLTDTTPAAAGSIGGIDSIIPIDVAIDGGPPLVSGALSKPFVDGGFVRTRWREVEPQAGRFDWSYLDAQVAALAVRHRKASVAVDAGESAPDWLYTMGAQSLSTVVEIPRQKDFCNPIRVPIPWDETFLREWNKLVAAMGAHFAANANVTVVKITGIAYRTDEILLPRGTGTTARGQGISCTYPNDVQNWVQAGYTSTKVISSFRRILSAYNIAFPNQSLAMMTGERGLPPLGVNGQPDDAASDLPETVFWQDGRQSIGARFIGQVNNLTDFRIDENLARFGQQSHIAYQAAWPVTNDPNCIMNRGQIPCDPVETMQITLRAALATHPVYLELFKEDLVNPEFAAMLQEAHDELSAGSR